MTDLQLEAVLIESAEIYKKDFIARLVSAGWTQHEAQQEWLEIQNDTEGDL